MNNELNSLWNKVLKEIKTEVSQANYAFLFKQTKLVSLENNKATVGAPSIMVIDLLQSRFKDQIKKLLCSHTGEDVSVVFTSKNFQSGKTDKGGDAPLFEGTQEEVIRHMATTILGANPEISNGVSSKQMRDASSPSAKIQHAPVGPIAGQGLSIGHLPRVRPDFTFSNFAVSTTNQLAFVSASSVAANIGKTYNPFFIYGPVGVGKTHLMHAIANDVYRRDPDKKIIYITSEEFTNEVVEAIRHNETARMKRRFRSAYLLLIDDIQFIEGKDKVQEELFHTFNILIDNGSQIALSSDRPPHEIKKLEKRLSSRFAGGLTVDIEEPDFELKAAILLIKAKKYGYELPIDVAKLLAENATDTRSLEGLLLRIITQSNSGATPIDIEFAKRALSGAVEEKRTHLHADDVIKHVCEYYNVKPTQIRGPKRDAGLVRARQVAMYLLKERLGMTQVEIGNLLGGRDHTTIMHGVDKVKNLVENKDRITEDIAGITKLFNV